MLYSLPGMAEETVGFPVSLPKEGCSDRHRDSPRDHPSLGKAIQKVGASSTLPKQRASRWWVSSASVRVIGLARLVHCVPTQFWLNLFINQNMSATVKRTVEACAGLITSIQMHVATPG